MITKDEDSHEKTDKSTQKQSTHILPFCNWWWKGNTEFSFCLHSGKYATRGLDT